MAANAADRADVLRQAEGQNSSACRAEVKNCSPSSIAAAAPGPADRSGRSVSRQAPTFAAVNPTESLFPHRPIETRDATPGSGATSPASEPMMGKAWRKRPRIPRLDVALASRRRLMGSLRRKSGEVQPRERFVESAYWNPSVVTGQDGKARVTFKAPAALSEYRITARGVTGTDTLAGQTTASLKVKKDFFVDLKVPGSLTQGDKPRFIAQVHHKDVRGMLALRLATYAGGRDDVFPKTLDLKGDGMDEVVFEPYEVPEGDSLRLTLTGVVGEVRDDSIVEVPIRPWGVPVYASASGTGIDSTTVFVGLPAGRTYENPEMLITLSPTVQRMLVELAIGAVDLLGVRSLPPLARCLPPPTNTTADRAADLLAAASVLAYLRDVRATAAPEARRLTEHIQSLVAELIAAQNPDGGWPWVTRGPLPQANANQPPGQPSERLTSAAVFWALATAERLGLLTDPKVLDQAVSYLGQQFSQLDATRLGDTPAMLHALSTRRAASFEAANSLNRARNQLSDPALAYLALTFANLDRPTLAAEVIGILGPRAKTEAPAPGRPSRLFWDRAGRQSFARSTAEITAMVTLAYARVKPDARELDQAVELADRSPRRRRLAAAQGQGPGPGRAGLVLRPRPRRRGSIPAHGDRQRRPGRGPRRAGTDRRARPSPCPGPASRSASPTASASRWKAAASSATRRSSRGSPATSAPTRNARPHRLGRTPGLSPVRPGAGRQDAPGRILGRGQPDDLREPGQPGRPRRPGPRRPDRLAQRPLEHARMGA